MAAEQITLQESGHTSLPLSTALACLDSAWVALVESHPPRIESLLQDMDELILLMQDSRPPAMRPGRPAVAHLPVAYAPAWSKSQLLLLAHRLLALGLLLRHTAQNLLLLDISRQAGTAAYPHAQHVRTHLVPALHFPAHHVPTHHAPVGGLTQWLR